MLNGNPDAVHMGAQAAISALRQCQEIAAECDSRCREATFSLRSPTVTNGYHVLANTLSLIQQSTCSHRDALMGSNGYRMALADEPIRRTYWSPTHQIGSQ